MSSPSYSKKYKLKYGYTGTKEILDYVPVVFSTRDQDSGFVIDYNTLNLSAIHPLREMSIRLVYSYKNNFVFNIDPNKPSTTPENMDIVFYLNVFAKLSQPHSSSGSYFSLQLKVNDISVHINGVKLERYMLKEEIAKIVTDINKNIFPLYRDLPSINVDLFDDLKIPIDMYIRHIYKVITTNTAPKQFPESLNRISPLNVTIGIS